VSLLKFYVRYPDGRQEEYPIDTDRALIGSGAHCEIRLPPEAAQVEHVSIQASASGIYAQTLAFDPPPLVGGVQFTQGTLLPDTPLILGGIEILVSAVDLAPQTRIARTKQEKTSPLTLAMGALMLPLLAFVLLFDDETSGVGEPPKKVPPLWGDPVKTCPQTGSAQALAVAQERYAIAETKRERSPFDIRDGIAAVPLYEIAAVCFQSTGNKEASDEALAAAKELRDLLQRDYSTHAVWLEHTLKVQDWRAAQREVSLMIAFTEGKKGEYVTWLSNTDRYLRIKFGQRAP
jgi:hypothetical protein